MKRLFHTVEESPTRVAVRCNGGMELRWATLELVKMSDLDAAWIVRRFDWFDPMPERDPAAKQAVTGRELRELLTILDKLNADYEEQVRLANDVITEIIREEQDEA
jgi:hypothetical protein